MDKPIVSICCQTYNHKDYIIEALEGFLMQKINFVFEILLRDDASTDGTAEICYKYANKYPDSIKLLAYTENQYQKGVRPFIDNVKRAKGKYIALCEGDDYWTDPYKLQKQVDFLEANEEYSLCFHNCEVILENLAENASNNTIGFKNIDSNRIYEPTEVLKQWTIPTASVLFRQKAINKEFYDIISNNKKFMYGDIVLFLFIAKSGKLFGLTDKMSVYRRHEGGLTNIKPTIDFDIIYSQHLLEIIKVFGKKYKRHISTILGKVFFSQALYSLKNKNFIQFFYSFYYVLKFNPQIIYFYLKGKTIKK